MAQKGLYINNAPLLEIEKQNSTINKKKQQTGMFSSGVWESVCGDIYSWFQNIQLKQKKPLNTELYIEQV
jgi:hypothetical protein